jgi:hypothetical protein
MQSKTISKLELMRFLTITSGHPMRLRAMVRRIRHIILIADIYW